MKQAFQGTGRRKTAVARIRMQPGTGTVVINKRSLEEYFPVLTTRQEALRPIAETKSE
ncbi:MAG: 30S ribosomal protein S9, partial [Candidatus Kapaibacterium sp.]